MFETLKKINAVSVPCFDFTSEDGRRTRKTVIISIIRFMENEDGSITLSWACSRGIHCYDPNCRYSKIGRERE